MGWYTSHGVGIWGLGGGEGNLVSSHVSGMIPEASKTTHSEGKRI